MEEAEAEEETEKEAQSDGEYRSFFFPHPQGISRLVFTHGRVKEASAGIIRTMHTQKKGFRERIRGEGEKRSDWGEKPRKRERRGRCRLLLICEITLPFFSRPFPSRSLRPNHPPSLLLFLSSQLVTLPSPSCFWVCCSSECGSAPLLDLPDDSPGGQPSDFPSHCFCRAAQSYLSIQLLSRVFLPAAKKAELVVWYRTSLLLRFHFDCPTRESRDEYRIDTKQIFVSSRLDSEQT